jgi:RimJ/RimL family protein N-acetyltransferase
LNLVSKYNISLRLVEESDADFIVKIRTDDLNSRYISTTSFDVEKQKLWIREYQNREKAGEELYLIAEDESKNDFATYRLYNKIENSIEIGSFVSKPNYDNALNVIKVDIILKSYVFYELGLEKIRFEVRKENKSVVNYHKKFNPMLLHEDYLNYYYVLEKDSFLATSIKFEELF